MSLSMFGDFQETFRTEKQVGFDWRIQQYLVRSPERRPGTCYSSPYFSFLGTQWHLQIYPYGRYLETDSIVFDLERLKFVPVQFSLVIKRADGGEETIVLDKMFSERCQFCTVTNVLLDSERLARKSQLAPSAIITFTCRIRSNEPPLVKVPEINMLSLNTNTESVAATSSRKDQSLHLDSTAKKMASREPETENVTDTGSRAEELGDLDIKGVVILRKHLKDLLLNEDYHDVTFKVKDRKFRAHRSMLTARSPVFAAMFKHEMKESTDDPIDIVDCSPEAFGEFLQYVYTGKVENFSPSIALGLYYAGDKYDVSGLKEVSSSYENSSRIYFSIKIIMTSPSKSRTGSLGLTGVCLRLVLQYLQRCSSTK